MKWFSFQELEIMIRKKDKIIRNHSLKIFKNLFNKYNEKEFIRKFNFNSNK